MVEFSEGVTCLLNCLSAVRVFHWNEKAYGRHVALGSFYDTFSEWLDDFVETALGSRPGQRVSLVECDLLQYDNPESLLKNLKGFLIIDFPEFVNNEKDLINMRDELLGSLNKTVYLLGLS